jgi:hypothetical protein
VPGPVLHVVCKPNGSSWVERKLPATPEPGAAPRPWQEVQSRIRYVCRPSGERWSGEVQIPWSAILHAAAPGGADGNAAAGTGAAGGDVEPPALLRFNFVQHRTATGESASWCGPIDFGRDDSLMGCLILRDPQGPNNLAGNRGGASPATGER